jgi:hypothetical protein
MASRRDQENWQEDRLMIFLTAAATKGAQQNKGPDHGIQVVDPYSPLPHLTGFGQFSNQLPTIY